MTASKPVFIPYPSFLEVLGPKFGPLLIQQALNHLSLQPILPFFFFNRVSIVDQAGLKLLNPPALTPKGLEA